MEKISLIVKLADGTATRRVGVMKVKTFGITYHIWFVVNSFYYKCNRMLGNKLVPLDQDPNGFAPDNVSIDIIVNENGNLVSFKSVR